MSAGPWDVEGCGDAGAINPQGKMDSALTVVPYCSGMGLGRGCVPVWIPFLGQCSSMDSRHLLIQSSGLWEG